MNSARSAQSESRCEERLTIVLFGKTGNGKSSVGNIILSTWGSDGPFTVGSGLASITEKIEQILTMRKDIEVTDIPDFTNLQVGGDQIRKEISSLRKRLTNTRYAVLLAVRCDVRFTEEEYDIYKQFKSLWGEDICSHLIVAFTFGDRLERELHQELQTVNTELKNLLSDAGQQYVLFNDKSDKKAKKIQTEQLLKIIQHLPRQRQDVGIIKPPPKDNTKPRQNVDSDSTEQCCQLM